MLTEIDPLHYFSRQILKKKLPKNFISLRKVLTTFWLVKCQLRKSNKKTDHFDAHQNKLQSKLL